MSAIARTLGLVALAGATVACGSSGGTAAATSSSSPAAAASASPASKVIRTQLGQGTMADPLKIDAAGPNQLTVQTVTIDPGGVAPWHTHPGWENSLVTAGQLTLTVATDPGCAPRHLGPGQAFDVPANTAHTARNDGTAAVQLVVTYLGNKPGAALITPVTRPAGCTG
ncbi:MAG TPA: cupin domain-containing protein [Candidatus Dormibacteraeota bacterium]|jgi:quercetin dioxygenase-like cupin family protein|nr:cupin domain-containing protein [Candidatus Dormibacteraeota bacterium]